MGITRGRTRRAARGNGHQIGRLFDNAGHLQPGPAERLLGLSARNGAHGEKAFFTTLSDDTFAIELAEEAVLAMTSGEGQLAEDLNRDVDEDWGGPFVPSSASKEFASGTDASNIPGATREPFPKT